MFRTAGNIIRADINIGADGRPKGSGTVVFETAKDAQNAIGRPWIYSLILSSFSVQACTMDSTGMVARLKFARFVQFPDGFVIMFFLH